MLKKKKITARMLAVFLGLCSVIGSISTVNAAPILNVKEDKSQNSDTEKISEEENEEVKSELSYEGYTLKWEDSFDGDSLNLNDWNIETHEPGWVNNELQEYTDSSDNIYVKDGKLVLKPIKKVDENGNVSYTSGRVNTQNKHDFKYGIFEASAKVPEGKGFLPAFWMIPTNENLYGQWPRCGEIDIMEVLGDKTDTSYGTIHFGNPHSERQGNYTLDTGSFSDEYHKFSVEWEPGKIRWYVDGKLIHTADDWYSATEGQGEITYPAPFDQPFYLILNLAVGGNWPGNPDDTTDFENAEYNIDYVRVYQKDSYDENVEKPEKEVILRDPDENGNYMINGDFSVEEDLADEADWIFLTTLGGEASAQIKENQIHIDTTNEGTVDYSVQLVQPNLPMKKGGVYQLTFDAYAEEDRTMKVGVSAPDRSYMRYMQDTVVELSPEKKTYTYEFTMTNDDDANGRLEFNLGAAGSKASVKIGNVSLKKISEIAIEDDKKTILADGNYVYNGSFQEGKNRLGYWDVKEHNGAEVSVTNENNIRKLKIAASDSVSSDNPAVVSQSELALSGGKKYQLSFMAEGEAGKKVQVIVAGQSFEAELTGKEQVYTYKFTTEENLKNQDIVLQVNEPGIFYLDDIRVVEDSLIKNGSFTAGFAGYECFVDGSISSEVSYVVDSLSENNAADFTIGNTGDAAWKIQLKQNNIELEKDQWYRLSLEAKSSIDRKIMFALQRDGSADDNWNPYSGEKIIDLTSDYQTYDIVFQMKDETDLKTVLSISMGAVDGIQISQKHRVCIDNIKLEKIEMPEPKELLVSGSAHVQELGWQDYVTDGELIGTSGQAKRLEAVRIRLENNSLKGSIVYRAHVQDIGWQDYVTDGELAGTTGKSKRLEAIEINLTEEVAEQYDIYYRAHIQNYGWLGWAKNGEKSGSQGYGLRMEGIEIQLVKKGETGPESTGEAFIKVGDEKANPELSYMAHVQNIGWQPEVMAGELCGTEGKSLRMEALKVNLDTDGIEGEIRYAAHVQNIGWQSYVQSGELAGTTGKSLRIEAVKMQLTEEMAERYDIYYRTYIQNYGWLGWAKNGEIAGSVGHSLRVESIEIQLVEKGQKAPESTKEPSIR